MKPNQACILLAAALLPLSTLWLRAADASSPTPSAESELAKRQQLVVSANQSISDGQRLLGSGQYDAAAERFQYALDALSPVGVTATSYERAETGLAAAKAGQAQQLAKDDKFAEAATKLREAIALQPSNPVYAADIEDLKKQQIAYEEQVRDPEGTINNPAVTDDLKDRIATIQKLLFQGDAYFRTGQYDKSEETYSKILILDPYNKAARNKMDHVEKYRYKDDVVRHEQYEQEAMGRITHGWAEAISPDIVAGPAANQAVTEPSNRAKITRKLQSIIIDKVNFDKLDIGTVIQFLTQKSKELDPDHEGINFVLRLTSDTPPPADANAPAPAAGAAPDATQDATHTIHREVSITLENVPLADVLGYIIQQTNLQYSVEDYAVYLRPSIDEGETLTVRTYLVPPDFFTGAQLRVTEAPPGEVSPSTVESVSVSVQQELTDRGIRFPAGSAATFLPGSSKLVVRDTPEQLDLIANLIEQLSTETPQVQIEAKVAEFTQDAIKSLSFNYLEGTGTIGPTGADIGASSALRTAAYTSGANNGGLAPDSIDTLIQSNGGVNGGVAQTYPLQGVNGPTIAPNTPNVLTIGAIIDGKGLMAVMDAINNTTGVSLLSAPTVTTQNGLKADIDIVREFPYPTSFEKPKLSNNSALFYPGTSGFFLTSAVGPLSLAIPPTPREFVTEDIGVILEVKPTTYPDQRIDLDITKAKVVDFDGFINYGVPIRARLTEDSTADPRNAEGTVLTEGVLNQPVFNIRSIETTLQVLDGQTAVLGGLINENTQEINDKVPVLGDLPLFGRLFQSKTTERTKKNLLIFVTARLIKSNGKPQYIQTLEAEPEEEALPEPDQQVTPGATLPPLPEGEPNS